MALGLGALGAVVFFLYRMRDSEFQWNLFLSTFRQLHPGWIAAATLLILLTYVGRVLRWQVMIKPIRPDSSFRNLLIATFIGFTAVVLFGRPGEFVRPYLIAMKEKVTVSSQLAAWFLERIYDLLIVILLFGFALTHADPDQASLGPALQWVIRTGGYFVAGLGVICVIILIMAGSFSHVFERRVLGGLSFLPEVQFSRAERLIRAFSGGMESTRSRYFVLQLILYSLAEWMIIVGATYCIFKAYPRTEHFTMVDTTMFIAFIAFGSVVQVPGIGGGMQVAAVLILTEFFGLTLEVSSGLAILIWLMTYVLIIPIGLLLALHEGLNWKTLKNLEEKTAP